MSIVDLVRKNVNRHLRGCHYLYCCYYCHRIQIVSLYQNLWCLQPDWQLNLSYLKNVRCHWLKNVRRHHCLESAMQRRCCRNVIGHRYSRNVTHRHCWRNVTQWHFHWQNHSNDCHSHCSRMDGDHYCLGWSYFRQHDYRSVNCDYYHVNWSWTVQTILDSPPEEMDEIRRRKETMKYSDCDTFLRQKSATSVAHWNSPDLLLSEHWSNHWLWMHFGMWTMCRRCLCCLIYQFGRFDERNLRSCLGSRSWLRT